MSEETETYSQPQKKKARSAVLGHAVESLTRGRVSSPLVTLDKFHRLSDYCVQYINQYGRVDLTEPMAAIRSHWEAVQVSRVGNRSPNDLKVLFLCGPEPLNDLEELIGLGVAPENVWAVEGDEKAFRKAATELREAGRPIKLHQGSLHEFLSVVPEQFDIVYFDACGPLFGGKPKTSTVLRELFLNQRMAPLSVLITNFAAKPRDTEDEWVKRLSVWYAPRYFQPVWGNIDGAFAAERISEPDEFYAHIKKNLEGYYSDFVSRFTIEFASQLLPWWRARALPSARRAYFGPESRLNDAIASAFSNGVVEDASANHAEVLKSLFDTIGHAQLSPAQYQFLWTAKLAVERLKPNDPLLEILTKDTLLNARLCDAINAVSLVRNFFESIGGGWGQHNRHACSDELREVLERFHWFDSPGAPWDRMFCDSPLPNLVIDMLMGVYGYPYHTNMEKLKRIEYTAKQTPMYSDVFVLDQCRYMYDLIPTLAMFGDSLPPDRQLQIRICISLIGRHTFESCRDLYRGSALADMAVEGFNIIGWPNRDIIH